MLVSEEARYIELSMAPSLTAASAEVVNEQSRFGLNVATGTHAIAVTNVVEAAGIEGVRRKTGITAIVPRQEKSTIAATYLGLQSVVRYDNIGVRLQ